MRTYPHVISITLLCVTILSMVMGWGGAHWFGAFNAGFAMALWLKKKDDDACPQIPQQVVVSFQANPPDDPNCSGKALPMSLLPVSDEGRDRPPG